MAVAPNPETIQPPAFPATGGERLGIAAAVSVPVALLVGATAAVAVGPAAGAVAGALVLAALVPYVARFLAADASDPEAAVPLEDGPRCAVCGAGFAPARPNQRYCGPTCRARAGAARRARARSRAVPRSRASTSG
ncbi:MAG TPA: hypothetical protein VLB86_04785 [Gaiellaceae bacterium]|nr:hypothetical protein [Gaiellaceae bacterium]